MEVVKWLKPSGSRPWRMSGSYALLTRRLSTPDGQRLAATSCPLPTTAIGQPTCSVRLPVGERPICPVGCAPRFLAAA